MKCKHKQNSFVGKDFAIPNAAFGGSLLKGHPKIKRPRDSKFPLHLVLKAVRSGMRHPGVLHKVDSCVAQTCKKHRVKIYRYANVGNHLHLLIKLRSFHSWAAFIRELAGRLGHMMQLVVGQSFWKHRPFTRIVKGWRRAFRIVVEYIELNELEAQGLINRLQTQKLKKLRQECSP